MKRSVNATQILIGAAVLFIGSFVYLIDRPPEHTYFVSSTGIALHDILPNIFGPVGSVLPAFVHVFSFILLTVGFMSCRKRGCLIICMSWLLVDSAFELGQEFNTWTSTAIPDWFMGIPVLENSATYFISGTFDYFDLAAITIGAALAYFVSLATLKRRNLG